MKKFVVSAVVAAAIGAISLSAQTYATVNGKNITEEDMAMILRSMPGAKFENLPQKTQEQVMDQAIERKLLTDLAKKEKIEQDKEFKDALDKIKEDLALEVWMKKMFDKVAVNEAESKAFYDKNPDRFQEEAKVKAKHILVKDENEAKEIIKNLETAGDKLAEKFAELASTKSLDTAAAKNGGDLGWFTSKQMVKEFSEAAFGLKKGEMGKAPIKTQFGYHVILVEDIKAAGKMEFDKVKKQIGDSLRMDKFRDQVQAKAKELRKSAKIEIKK